MLLIARATARTMTPDDPQIGFARVAVSMVLRLLAALAALLSYYVWIRPGLAPFGIGLIAGFLVMIAIEMFRLGRRSSPSVR
jgi:zinc transporter ZupT